MTAREKIVSEAISHLGETENPPNSNKTIFGAWYGFDGFAWCAQFVSYVFFHAGCPIEKIDDEKGYRGCQSAYNFWKKKNMFTTTPQSADIVLFSWKKDGKQNHTGIFLKDNGDGKTFTSIEGNTDVGNDSDGGKVMYRKRNYSTATFVNVDNYLK